MDEDDSGEWLMVIDFTKPVDKRNRPRWKKPNPWTVRLRVLLFILVLLACLI